MTVDIVLFQAIANVQVLQLPPGTPSSGTKFENFMVQQLYQTLRQQRASSIYPPRYTLHEPTCSGVSHQFDLVIRENDLTTVECKFEGRISIAELFAYLGKLVDYRSVPRGIFVTVARDINDEIWHYAIAHRILIVSPLLPPVPYMIKQVKSSSDLSNRLVQLQSRLEEG